MSHIRMMSVLLSMAFAVAMVPAVAQTGGQDATEWSQRQMEAEARRRQAEKQDFLDAQNDLAAQQETRRRMGLEEDRRRGPEGGMDADPLRGREDTGREIESLRQRFDSERRP